MTKMVNFMLDVFYHNLTNTKINKGLRRQEKLLEQQTWGRGRSQLGRRISEWELLGVVCWYFRVLQLSPCMFT